MRKLALILVVVVGALWLWVDITPERVTAVQNFSSPAIYDTNGKLFHVRLSPSSEWQIPISLDEMGKWLPVVAVNAEDGRFFRHFGIDPIALLRAAVQDLSQGRIISGASTITSQVIRLAVSEREGRPRSMSTKIREFIMALKLERNLSKPKILECYLNLAPFGGNIRGVQTASLIYFGKTASQLSPGEACLLIGMLKGPSLYRPDTKPKNALKRRNQIISLMERKGVFDRDTAKRAYLEELPRRKFNTPSRAWHYSELLFSQFPEHSQKFNTTLNIEIQTKLESLLGVEVRDLPGDVTIAAGIADNATGELTAWVGNARFSFKNDWVDCGLALRSPGSTLKPFAYLCAFDEGILTPSTLLADTSSAFSGRAPRNFDLTYRGAVSVRTALHQSLNAPAVRVLRNAGNDRVLTMLRASGFRHLTQGTEYYGDSLILGGCDVSVIEELEAYTAIASLGVHRPLKLLKESVQTERRIASPEACWLVSDILRYNRELLTRGLQISLKTGTSYGLRDAWACAWTPEYTVCVWVGKPDGSSWEGLVGARTAAPIAAKILRTVTKKPTRYERPEGLVLRDVCSLSGKPPIALCPSTKMDWAIDDVTRTVPCDIHRVKNGETIAEMPEGFSPESGRSLTIISPIPGASYFNAPLNNEHKIPLKAEGERGRIFWYVDGNYVGKSEVGRTLFHEIEDGEHSVSVADERGRSTTVTVKILTPGKNENEKLF